LLGSSIVVVSGVENVALAPSQGQSDYNGPRDGWKTTIKQAGAVSELQGIARFIIHEGKLVFGVIGIGMMAWIVSTPFA
jgi:hypothetical protein